MVTAVTWRVRSVMAPRGKRRYDVPFAWGISNGVRELSSSAPPQFLRHDCGRRGGDSLPGLEWSRAGCRGQSRSIFPGRL